MQRKWKIPRTTTKSRSNSVGRALFWTFRRTISVEKSFNVCVDISGGFSDCKALINSPSNQPEEVFIPSITSFINNIIHITPYKKKPISILAPTYLHIIIFCLKIFMLWILPKSTCLDNKGKDVTIKAIRLIVNSIGWIYP